MDYQKEHRTPKNKMCKPNEGLPIMGILLVGLGLVFLLDRLHIIPNYWRNIIISWPSLLIFIGLINIFKSHARFPGFILILVGSAFLIPNIIDIPFEASQLIWPVVAIVVGLFIVFKSRKVRIPHVLSSESETINGSEKIDEVAIFGGGKRVITSQNLKGGNITAIFGGIELDLTDAELADDIAVLEVACIFGGTTIITKPDWDVQVQVASILGGFTDKRKMYKRESGVQTKTLIIKGAAIFGGGEVKSY
jgi:predicted membrane protein